MCIPCVVLLLIVNAINYYNTPLINDGGYTKPFIWYGQWYSDDDIGRHRPGHYKRTFTLISSVTLTKMKGIIRTTRAFQLVRAEQPVEGIRTKTNYSVVLNIDPWLQLTYSLSLYNQIHISCERALSSWEATRTRSRQ